MEEDGFASSRVGTTLGGKYRVDSLLGVGGMAAVFRGAHRNGNRVAIKMLRPTLSSSANVRKRFLKEGYVANAVDHPGAVRVLDDDVASDGTPFLVMELLEGETLDARAKKTGRQLAVKEVAELAAQVLGVLDAAHAKGIIHRDIKPENLFLTRDGQLKVLDFGIARMRDGAAAQAVTRTGSMMGTPAFMPPEQALGLTKEIDGRTDLWALGATMFTLISGALVHEGETPESTVVLTATRPARSLASAAPTAPAAIVAVIDQALAFEKVDRHKDAKAMLASLAEAYGSAFGVPLPEPVLRDEVEAMRPAPAEADDDPESNPNFAATVLSDSTMPDRPPRARRAPSTTAGVTAEKDAPAADAMEASAPKPEPRRGGNKLRLMAAVGILVVGTGGSLMWLDQTPAAAPAKNIASGGESAASAGRESPAAVPLTTAATLGAVPASTASATIDSGSAPPATATALASATASAVVRPIPSTSSVAVAPRKPELPRATATAAPAASAASPDCSPPFYFDPVSGLKKVKPGC